MSKFVERASDLIGLAKTLIPYGRAKNMLQVGEKAPDFKLKTHEGELFALSEKKGKKVVLWFFPKADTPG